MRARRQSARVEVRVDRFDVEPVEERGGVVVVDCSSGTYIRSLAADLGTALGGVHICARATHIGGGFTLDDAADRVTDAPAGRGGSPP